MDDNCFVDARHVFFLFITFVEEKFHKNMLCLINKNRTNKFVV